MSIEQLNRPSRLIHRDLEMFRRIGIDADLLERAGIMRVTDQQARQEFGLDGTGNNAGILFPYVDAAGKRHTSRLRRDSPEMEDGKPVRKYLAPYGDRRHLYIVPGDHALGENLTVPVILVEAEKSALALRAFADRAGRQLLPIATGGCWGWRGRIGKAPTSKGGRVDELGPLPELGICSNGRKVFVLLDSNCNTNPRVQAARRALVHRLFKQNAEVHVLDLPAVEGVNGPDDFIALCGDDALGQLLDSPPAGSGDWRQLLIYRKTKGRAPQPERLLANTLTAFRYAPEWHGVLAFDQFSLRVVTRRPPVWRRSAGSEWSDDDDSRATEWLQREAHIFVSTAVVAEAVQTVARENPFHPVLDYLNKLVWDRVPRIGAFLNRYLFLQQGKNMRNAVNRPLTVGAAADALGLSVHTVRAWIANRRLRHVRLGRAIRVLPADIKKLLRSAVVPVAKRRE